MKQFIATVAVATVLAVGLAGSARADSASDLAAIQAIYDNQCTSMQAADMDGYASTLASDFQISDANGNRLDRDQYVAELRALYQSSGVQLTACTIVASSLVANDDGTVSVHTVQDDSATANSRSQSDETITDDVWVSQSGGWLLERCAIVSVRQT